jgi:hypothetical protein
MFIKHYVSIRNGILNLKDMPADVLNSRKVMLISVASAFKFGYVAIDETNVTFEGKECVAIVAKEIKDGTLLEIIVKQ